MMPLFPIDLARQAGSVVIAGLWQGIAIACVLTFSLRPARRIPAAQRFLVWAAGFVAVAALPLVPGFSSLLGLGQAAAGAPSGAHVLLHFDLRWTLAIAAVWLVGSTVRAADLIFHAIRLGRLWRSAVPIEVPGLPNLESILG